MYHDIINEGAEDDSGFPGADAALYKVTLASFAAHLAALTTGYQPVDLALTFDDGGASARVAADLLEARHLRGSFFVTADYIGRRGFVDAGTMRDLQRRGHLVGSHSCSHPLRMGACSSSQLRDEWTRSHAIISDILGTSISTASVPGGDYTPRVGEAAARAGFTTLFTSEPTPAVHTLGDLVVRGRYTIQRWTSAATAAALAHGSFWPAARQALLWNAKKATKRIGGERYLQMRGWLVGRSAEVKWGDR